MEMKPAIGPSAFSRQATKVWQSKKPSSCAAIFMGTMASRGTKPPTSMARARSWISQIEGQSGG